MTLFRSLCLFTLLWIVSCGKSDQPAAATPPPEAPAIAAATPEPPPAKPAPALTPQLENAAVLVRVSVAALQPREHTGILLRSDALTPPLPPDSPRRFIAVNLPAYDEQTLREPRCSIQVLRQKQDVNGTPYVMQFVGFLAHFNAATHDAILQITEDFPCQLDTGLSLGTATGGLSVLQSIFRPRPEAHETKAMLPFKKSPGTGLQGTLGASLLPATRQDKSLTVADTPDTGPANVSSAAVLSSDGQLAGFAVRKQGLKSLQFEPFSPPPTVEEQWLSFVPQSVQCTTIEAGYNTTYRSFKVTVKGELKDPGKECKNVMIVMKNMPAADFTPAANPRVNQPIIERAERNLGTSVSPEGLLEFTMHMPEKSTSGSQLVQVIVMNKDREEAFHAAPFLIVTNMRGQGLYHSVTGLPQPASSEPPPATSPSGAAASAGTRELTTESRILYGVPIAEGREVLFKLAAAPFWKRLSLADGKWLPLPAEDLSNCHMAGNKDALFVLQPDRREIRRYNAATLALENNARLTDGLSYQGLAAGCLSDDAPLAIIEDHGAMACDPRELTPHPCLQFEIPSGHTDVLMENKYHFEASGDAGRVWGHPREKSPRGQPSIALPVFLASELLHGYEKKMVYARGSEKYGRLPMVAASYAWHNGIFTPGADVETHKLLYQQMVDGIRNTQLPARTVATLACSPNLCVISQAARVSGGVSQSPPQCTLYSCFSEEPWATLDIPEAGDVPSADWSSFARRVWLDPASLSLAVWHHDQTITQHTLDRSRLPEPKTPVLLNFPDCYVPRGSDFHFTPLLLGRAGQVSVTNAPSGMDQKPDGTLDWKVPAYALPRQVTFGMTFFGAQPAQTPCELKIELQLGGEPPVVAVPATMNTAAAEAAIANDSQRKADERLIPLNSRIYRTERPILRVESGLNDYLALRMVDKSLELLSIGDWKVAGRRQLNDTSTAFMAGDVIFIYDSAARELTRHALPGLNVTGRLHMPRTARLYALGAGVEPAGPLTILLEEKVLINQPGYSPTSTKMECTALVLDRQTLRPGGWAAYDGRLKPGASWSIISNIVSQLRDSPAQIPASKDGRLLSFPIGLVMISPALSVDFDYSKSPLTVAPFGRADNWHIGSRDATAAIASPTGGRVFWNGRIYFNNYPFIEIFKWTTQGAVSRCGNYVAGLKSDVEDSPQLTLFSADDGRPLLNLAGLEILKIQDGGRDSHREQMAALGDKNLLAILSRGGRILQGISLDLAATCLAMQPDSAYVTSHPFPILAAGRSLDYQVVLSNPDAATGYTLRDVTPGASIDEQGRFTYQSLATLDESEEVSISIQIHLKSGETLLHQFPIYVISLKPAAVKKGPSK